MFSLILRRSASVLFFAGISLAYGAAASAVETNRLAVSPSGHYFTYGDRVVMLVGDSGTHCVMQNLNIDYRSWIGDLASRGMTAAHVWAFVPPRQKQDGSITEKRYGYLYPGATPWKRKESGPAATDQLPQWDLKQFDEGDDPTRHYWPRLRDMAECCRRHKLCLGVTLFFGWPKHETHWSYHPLHVANGGHLTNRADTVRIECPGTEVVAESWSDEWSNAKKTQWVWERYCQKMIRELGAFDNVFFHYKDERSYEFGWEGFRDNMDDHFVEFFRKRGEFVLVDWEPQRDVVNAVLLHSGPSRGRLDLNDPATAMFTKEPFRPAMYFEGEPYELGNPNVRLHMWTFAIGGGHFFFHDDERQGAVTTGIMAYDSNTGGKKPSKTYDWLGILSRFFNGKIAVLDKMKPSNELLLDGNAYCLANPGTEYACYLPKGGSIRLKTTETRGRREAILYDPRTGSSKPIAVCEEDNAGTIAVNTPDQQDWAILIKISEGGDR